MNLPYRFCTFGDTHYRIAFSEHFNSEQNRKYPPPLTGSVRLLAHKIVGFSDLKTRLISAVFVLLACGSAVLAVNKLILKNAYLSLSLFVFLAFNPSIWAGGRTMRFEQEILFLGVFAAFSPLFLAGIQKSKKSNCVIWLCAGFACALSACSHPWGLVFLAAQLIFICVYRSWLTQLDGLSTKDRIGIFSCGAAIPFSVSAALLISDFEQFRQFQKALSAYYHLRELQNIENLAAQLPWTQSLFSKNFLSHIAALQYVICFRPYDPWFSLFFRVCWFISAFLCVVLIVALYRRRWHPIFTLNALLVGLFSIAWFVYPPSENYYLYPAFACSMFFGCLLLFAVVSSKRVFVRYGLTAYLAAVTIFCATYCVLTLSSDLARQVVSVDARLSACENMAKLVGWTESNKQVFADFSTWPAAGRDGLSIVDRVIFFPQDLPVPEEAGVCFDTSFLAALLSAPNLSDVQFDRQFKVQRLRASLKRKKVLGYIVSSTGNSVFFGFPMLPSSSLFVTEILSGGSHSYRIADLPKCESNDNKAVHLLDPGDYLLTFRRVDENQHETVLNIEGVSSPLVLSDLNKFVPEPCIIHAGAAPHAFKLPMRTLNPNETEVMIYKLLPLHEKVSTEDSGCGVK